MSFQKLTLKQEYRSPQDDVVKDVFIPALTCAKIYKRAVGFFSSTSLSEITKGIDSLVENDGKIQIVASPHLSESDEQAIKLGYEKRLEVIEKKLLGELDKIENDYFKAKRLNILANLIANNILDLKIAFTDSGNDAGMYHEKLGIFEDGEGNKICFDGSMNESITAMRYNYESVNIYCSWKLEDKERCVAKVRAFENIWNNTDKNLMVVDFPSVTQKILDKYKRKDFSKSELTKKAKEIDEQELNPKKVEYIIPEEKELEVHDSGNSEMTSDVLITPIECELPNNTPTIPSDMNFYDYQKEAIEKWTEQNYCGIFDMATGTGKTLTGLGAITKCANDNNNELAVIIVVPYQHLVEQWVEDIVKFNIKPIIAYSSSAQKDWKNRLKMAINSLRFKSFFCLVTTNATFKSDFVQEQLSKIKGETLLVIDEAHNAGSKNFAKFLDKRFTYRLALSATLERHHDEEGSAFLHEYFGEKAIEYDLGRAIEEKKLTPYRYYPVLVYLSEDESLEYRDKTSEMSRHIIKGKNGKIKLDSYGELLAIQRSRIIAGAINKIDEFKKQILPYKDKNNLLVYCGATTINGDDLESDSSASKEDFDKSELGERQIIAITKIMGKELGMSVSRFTSEEDIETRKIITQKFKDEELQAIIAIKCLDEGVNIPSIKTAFILASTTNPKEYIQRRGRVLRLWKGKSFAEIYDFITLPRDLDTVKNFTKEEVSGDLSLVKNELRRMKEFSRLALNEIDSLSLISDIQDVYEINDKDLNILNTDTIQEEFNEQ